MPETMNHDAYHLDDDNHAAAALVAEDLFIAYRVALRGGPGSQDGELAVDGLLAFLAFGRDAGIEGNRHGGVILVDGTKGSE